MNTAKIFHACKQLTDDLSHVEVILIAIGSNYQADANLALAKNELKKIGEVVFSDLYINPDYTELHKPIQDRIKPDYTNQCAYLKLNCKVAIRDVKAKLKNIENQCGRQHQALLTNKLVDLDLDILAVKRTSQDNWLVVKKRYPFKKHEWVGINQLLVDDTDKNLL